MIRFSLLCKITIPVLIIFAITSCGNSSISETKPATDTIAPVVSNKDLSIPGSFSNQTVLTFDSIQIKKFLEHFPAFKVYEKDIYSFYQRRKFAYAWFDDKGLIETAHNLYNRIQNINEEGLPDKIHYKEIFTGLLEADSTGNKPSTELELMLTGQYLEYARNVWQGISEKESLAIDWLLPRKKLSYSQLLDSLAGSNILENEPVYKQYHLLKEALKKLNSIKIRNDLPVIKTSEKKLKEGDSAAIISVVRKWFFIMGDIGSDNQSAVFDPSLAVAVKSFQSRNGLKEDGIITPTVIAEMNYPLEKRMETIMVNMERSRWVPADLKRNYLLVNVPDYQLHIIENDSLAFSMNVVVGKSQHKTVVFNGDVKYVVFSPYWNVPTSILRNEIQPAIRRNRNYLAQHNMEWSGNGVRQKPGPNNSLGLVKFLFPNSHNIYLHDSPAKSLFNETSRAFSHGCIRVSDARKLAIYLLKNDPKWNEASIDAAMNSGKEQTVTLSKSVPVFIAYFTAWVDKTGRINFRKDLYGRDSRLAKMILAKPSI